MKTEEDIKEEIKLLRKELSNKKLNISDNDKAYTAKLHQIYNIKTRITLLEWVIT